MRRTLSRIAEMGTTPWGSTMFDHVPDAEPGVKQGWTGYEFLPYKSMPIEPIHGSLMGPESQADDGTSRR
jgi:hypothetical protein